MGSFERLWIGRKCGKGMSARYVMSSFLPLIVIFLITSALVFATVFINSVSRRIDRMIEVLGSGSVYAYDAFDHSILPSAAEVSAVSATEALIYAENGERAVAVKCVDESYFSGERGRELGVSGFDAGLRNPVVISSSLASSLSLEAGDRATLMLYEREKERARPVLVTVSAVFDSIYPQLDSRLIYAELSLIGTADGFEILLPEDSDNSAVLSILSEHGVAALTSEMLYRSEYSNIRASISVLYVIFALIAVLAAYFASDAAEYFAARDRKDIAELMLLGAERREIERIYLSITAVFVEAALVLGALSGIALSYLSPAVIEFISRNEGAFLDYYVRSFSVSIPWLSIAVMLLLSLFVSLFSIYIAIRRSTVANIISAC